MKKRAFNRKLKQDAAAQRVKQRRTNFRWNVGVLVLLCGAMIWMAVSDGRLGGSDGLNITQMESDYRVEESPLEKAEALEPKMEPELAEPEPVVDVAPVVPKIPEPISEPKVEEEPEKVVQEVSEPNKRENKFANEELLQLRGMASERDAEKERDLALIDTAMEYGQFVEYLEFVEKSLAPAMANVRLIDGRNRYDELLAERALYIAFLRWHVLGKLPAAKLAEITANPYQHDWLVYVLTHPEPMEEIMNTLHQEDDAEFVIEFLSLAWEAKPELGEKYFSLALASGVVFDHLLKFHNAEEYGEESVVDPLERYLWYVEKNEKGKLAAPVDRQRARELVWVVCAPVTTDELEWALRYMNYSRKGWGAAYGEIEYLMERAVEGQSPYEEYTFAEIRKEGGICGDQSYYCANTARAAGIPAMIISGETNSGAHAWVGLKVKPDEWDTTIGRIGGVAEGRTTNPQTDSSITEQEVWMWNDRDYQRESTFLAVFRHLWLADYFEAMNNDEESEKAVTLANKLGETFIATWERVYVMLEMRSSAVEDRGAKEVLEPWKSFIFDVRRQFRENPRMAELARRAEDEQVFPYSELNDIRRDLNRERQRLQRYTGEQADLIADNLKREADLITDRLDEEATKEICRLYDSSLRRFGGSVTGFKEMARDYFNFIKDDPELARKAVRDIELAFKRVIESGSKDWFRAKTESEIYEMICTFYREVGDQGRAELLEKRYKRMVERAERGAL